ncbi:hypothetical protein [Marinobacter zhejiangensis]|uniref:Uncharacterized protein n=1 Tax=Marinobacter zhejiangensis TaxID=488535 RepID=A0A1I4M8I2_9GAMM|nr:hypothetical protein [Marinobacter zhejiangensis]SFL99568.1 hypothetical protein SAMN04487963_0919 [Marinobacter zhejiangensis]
MKYRYGLIMLALPLVGQAGGYPHGLSDTVIEAKPRTQTEQALQRQRDSGPPEQGELSTQVYVDTQERISETFRRPVPERMADLNTKDE